MMPAIADAKTGRLMKKLTTGELAGVYRAVGMDKRAGSISVSVTQCCQEAKPLLDIKCDGRHKKGDIHGTEEYHPKVLTSKYRVNRNECDCEEPRGKEPPGR
jgi:hypothetical protein